MKKLMIAAAAAAMIGGAFADCSDPATDYCLVYDLKVTLKTLGPKAMKCKATCGDGTVYYLDTVTRTLKGYAWSCDYDCECDKSGSTTLQMALWEPKASLGWWMYDATAKAADVTWDALETIRYAKTGNKAAVYFTMKDKEGTDNSNNCPNSTYVVKSTLTFAAVGGSIAYDKNYKDCIIKSLSGNVVGGVTPDLRCSKSSSTKKSGSWCEDGQTTTVCCADYTALYTCLCNCDVDWCDSTDQYLYNVTTLDLSAHGLTAGQVPAVGTWSLKYNASYSKGKKNLTSVLPKYAQK